VTADGFSKINVPNSPQVDDKAEPVFIEKKMKIPKKILGIFAIFFIIIVASVGITAIFARDFYYSLNITKTTAQATFASAKTQNIEEAKKGLVKLEKDWKVTQEKYNKLSYLKFIPLLGSYWQDGYHGLRAGYTGIQAGLIATDALLPYADLLGLKGEGTFVGGSADQRIQTAVKTMDKITPRIKDISAKVESIKNDLDTIDPSRYPEKVGNTVIRKRLISLRNIFDESADLFINAQPLLEQLPKILGTPDAKRYLVLFQNDKELRPTGGFMTAYSLMKVKGGHKEDNFCLTETPS